MANRKHESIEKDVVIEPKHKDCLAEVLLDKAEQEEARRKKAEEYLAKKTLSGIGKTVESILNDESVKKLVEKTVVRQSIETGVFLSFLLIGMLTLANVAKALSGLTWQGDLIIGLTLISIGGVYMCRKLLFHK